MCVFGADAQLDCIGAFLVTVRPGDTASDRTGGGQLPRGNSSWKSKLGEQCDGRK